MKRVTVSAKPLVCPYCGFSPVGDIIYGLPEYSKELERDLRVGDAVLGGICIHPGRVKWACKNCGCEFELADDKSY